MSGVNALAWTLDGEPRPASLFAPLLAVLFGFTLFTNWVEGGTAVLGLLCAPAFIAWGIRRRDRLAWLLVPAYGVALAALVAWGIYWRGFAQFTELGWV